MVDFERVEALRGSQMMTATSGVLGGALTKLGDVEVVPLFFTSTSPGGPLSDSCYFTLRDEILERMRTAQSYEKLDGVLLLLHGAAVSESVDDIEGDLLLRVREIVGLEIPIMVTLDLHAHITQEMMKLSTALFGWETYPHMDAYTTGARAAKMMVRTLKGEINPVQAMAKVPVLTSAVNGSTEYSGPFFDLMKKAKAWEHEGKVLSSSVFLVHPYIDRPKMGSGALFITDGDLELAKECASEIASEYWQRRAEFEPEVWSPAAAIKEGLTIDGPVVLSEVADTVGGGAAGDCIAVLRTLIESGTTESAIYPVVDAPAAAQCHAAGVGAEILVNLGHSVNPRWGKPLQLNVKILKLSDGKFTYVGGIWSDRTGDMGASALVQIGSIKIVIASHPTYEWRDEQFRLVGIDAADEIKFIVAKNPMNYHMAYGSIAKQFFIIDSKGPTPATCKGLIYTKMKRPFFPFDTDIPDLVPEIISAYS